MFARCYEDRADRIYQRVDMGCEKRVRNASQIFDLCNHGTVVALNNLVHVMTIKVNTCRRLSQSFKGHA